MRVLVLCTHNSARSQLAEAWLRHYAQEQGLELEIWSAGTEKTKLKPEAAQVMREVGIDLSTHWSKTLYELPEPWNFDLVLTVCDQANEACPNYPLKTQRLHRAFTDPSGKPLEAWRRVRDEIAIMSKELLAALAQGKSLNQLPDS